MVRAIVLVDKPDSQLWDAYEGHKYKSEERQQ